MEKEVLDYNLRTPEERKACVERVLAAYTAENKTPPANYIQSMANYLLLLDIPKAHKNKEILTNNRLKTIKQRESSYQQIADALPGGEEDINLLVERNPRNIYLTNRETITDEDIRNIPGLKDLINGIKIAEKSLETAEGRAKYLLKKNIIEDQKTQYILKQDYINYCKPLKKSSGLWSNDLIGTVKFNEEGQIYSENSVIKMYDPEHIRILLNNYSRLKEDTWDDFHDYMKYVIYDLENLIDENIKEVNPIYFDILVYKIDGLTNKSISEILNMKHNVDYSENRISQIWCHIIPEIITEAYIKKEMIHYFKQNNLPFKVCNHCGQVKPLTAKFWHKNKKSKDGFYYICKDCRSTKNKNIEVEEDAKG